MVNPLYHLCNFHFPNLLSFFCCSLLDYPPFVCNIPNNPACRKEQPWHLVLISSDGYTNAQSFPCKMETPLSGYFIHILFISHKDIPVENRSNTSPQNKRNMLKRFTDFFSCQTEVLWWCPGKPAQAHKPSWYKMKLYSKQEKNRSDALPLKTETLKANMLIKEAILFRLWVANYEFWCHSFPVLKFKVFGSSCHSWEVQVNALTHINELNCSHHISWSYHNAKQQDFNFKILLFQHYSHHFL